MNHLKTLISVALITLSANTYAGDIATVNGKAIEQSTFDYILKDAKAHGQKIDDNVKNSIKQKLIDSEIVYQAAQKSGLNSSADYKTKIALMQRELLMQTYLQNFLKKNPITEADLKKEYENYKKAYGAKEYNANHILVKTEDEAKALIKKINKGEDFAKLAQANSMDPGSKNKGGALGWFSPATMVKPFSEAIKTLKKGAVTATPVQTNFGWHIIKLVDSRQAEPVPYDRAKQGLEKKLQQMKLKAKMDQLRSQAKVVVK